jgi:hypothetical protein
MAIIRRRVQRRDAVFILGVWVCAVLQEKSNDLGGPYPPRRATASSRIRFGRLGRRLFPATLSRASHRRQKRLSGGLSSPRCV